jgi:hypothetical protein
MAGNPQRHLLIRSRLAEGYVLSEDALKHMQHVFTVWFPRAVFYDLTDDTVRVDVIVKKGYASGKGVYLTSFFRADDSVIKTLEYNEDRLLGKVCEHYDQRRGGYYGKKNGFDYRLLFYTMGPTTFTRR